MTRIVTAVCGLFGHHFGPPEYTVERGYDMDYEYEVLTCRWCDHESRGWRELPRC